MNKTGKGYEENILCRIFECDGTEVEFGIGQSLSLKDYLAGDLLLIKSGSARLIINEDNRPKTLIKLSAGDFVGVCSNLRGDSCEEVRASEKITALSLSAEKFKL